jgi:hypothetical protein
MTSRLSTNIHASCPKSASIDPCVSVGVRGVELLPRNKYCLIRHRQVQSAPIIPASIRFHMTVATERACFMIALGSGERMPCNTSSKKPALRNAS